MGVPHRSVTAWNGLLESNLASFEKGHQRGDGDDRHFRNQSIDDFKKLRLFQAECDSRARFMDGAVRCD